MNKKLKLLIFVMSGVVVAMLLGILLLSVISNLTSVEVNQFKLCATGVSQVSETDVNQAYLYVLTSGETEKEVEPNFMNRTGENGQRIYYYFVVSDTSVAEVLDKDNKFSLKLKQVGEVSVEVYNGINVGGVIKQTSTNVVGKYKIRVLKEIYKIDHVLSTSKANLMPITVNQKTSGNNVDVSFSSSNPSVAKVVEKDSIYYIEFYNEGTTIITAYASGNSSVQDRVLVNVYNNEPNELEFVDDSRENKIYIKRIYTDGEFYTINYNLISSGSGISQSSKDGLVNSNNVKVVGYSEQPTKMAGDGGLVGESAFDEDEHGEALGSGIVLDKDNQCIKVKKRINVGTNTTFEDSIGYITLQTYIYDENGNEVPSGTYTIFVEIIRKNIIALEVEVSNIASFDNSNKVIYYNKTAYNPLTWEGVESIMPSELYLSKYGEVRTIYFKVWNVWNNGDRELTSSLNRSVGSTNFGGSGAPQDIGEIIDGEDKTYSVFRLSDYFLNNIGSATDVEYKAFTISIHNGDAVLSVDLMFKCIDINLDLNDDANEGVRDSLYSYNAGVYTFNYWDNRFESIKTITDREGNITGFVS